MDAPSVGRITLEFEPGEPIHGLLLDGAGVSYRFHGWLELSGALEWVWQQSRGAANIVPPEMRSATP